MKRKSNQNVLGFSHPFRKTLFLAWVMLLLSLACRAQQADAVHLVDHKPLMNLVWKTFDQLMYKVTQQNGQTVYTPYFPEALKRLHGRTVTLRGYMVPIESGRRHHIFLLSVLPVYQCMFCGQNGIPPMAEITMADNTKLTFSEEPIAIRGTIYLNETDETRTEIQLRNAIRLVENK